MAHGHAQKSAKKPKGDSFKETMKATIRSFECEFGLFACPLTDGGPGGNARKYTLSISFFRSFSNMDGKCNCNRDRLRADFMLAAKSLARGFCESHNFKIENQENAWPYYSAVIVSKG
jgi:hypothetical protein